MTPNVQSSGKRGWGHPSTSDSRQTESAIPRCLQRLGRKSFISLLAPRLIMLHDSERRQNAEQAHQAIPNENDGPIFKSPNLQAGHTDQSDGASKQGSPESTCYRSAIRNLFSMPHAILTEQRCRGDWH